MRRAAVLLALLVSAIPALAQGTGGAEVFEVAEVQPELIGGLRGLQDRLGYPDLAWQAGIEGQVVVAFTVDERGNAVDLDVLRSPNVLLAEAAKQAVRESQFKPGQQRGRPVRVRYAVPVTFRIDRESPPRLVPATAPPEAPAPPPSPPAPTLLPLLDDSHDGPDFRESRWGDLRPAVRRTERGRPTVPYPGTIAFGGRVFDRDAQVLYTFAGDALKEAGYQFDTETRFETESLFDDLLSLLSSKYGEPTACRSDTNGTSAWDEDDERRCEWTGGRTRIVLRTNYDASIVPSWQFVSSDYYAADPAPIVEAGARAEAPRLFGGRAMSTGATALFGLDWEDDEAAVRRRLGRALGSDDDGAGRRVLFAAPEVAGYSGTVLATFYGGELQDLFASYSSAYAYPSDFLFFVAMGEAVLGGPTAEGRPDDADANITRYARWETDRALFVVALTEDPYGENAIGIVASAPTAREAESRDRSRHADDF